MGMLLSLSKPTAVLWLGISEWALLLFGIVLVVGLVGEHKGIKSAKWKARERIFSMLVVVGVAGELIADGGIFAFSGHVQSISDGEVAAANLEAKQAGKDAGDAKLLAAKIGTTNAQLVASNLALEKQVVELRKSIVEIVLNTMELEESANDRTFLDSYGAAQRLRKFAGVSANIASMPDKESRQIAEQILHVLLMAKWGVSSDIDELTNPVLTNQKGIIVQSFTSPYEDAAYALVGELKKSRIVANWHGVMFPFNPKFTPTSHVNVFVSAKPTPSEARDIKLGNKLEENIRALGEGGTGEDWKKRFQEIESVQKAMMKRWSDRLGNVPTNTSQETNAVK